jgi:hypothetical protein
MAQELLHPFRSSHAQRAVADRHHPLGPRQRNRRRDLNIVDDHSRLCIASVCRPVFKAANVDACFRDAAATWGDPARVLSDNGAVYTGRYRGVGRVALEVTLNARGIAFAHSRPYHPQTCGRWNGSTRPRSAGSATSALHHRRPACSDRSTSSAATTTIFDLTVPWADAHPTPPHRHRPTSPPSTSPDPRQGPPRPRHHHQRPATPRLRTRSQPGLPTPNQNVNDVPRHLCTVSRDIASVSEGGHDSLTHLVFAIEFAVAR